MKAQLIGNKIRGIITLEVLIAFAIVILCISAVIMVVFGNQFVAVDSETNNEAILKIQENLETAKAESRKDFFGVSSNSVVDGIYTKQNIITDISECLKKITTILSWQTGVRSQNSSLTTFLSYPDEALALGGDCGINPPVTGAADWHRPMLLTSVDRSTLSDVGTNDLDVVNGLLYIAASANASASVQLNILVEDGSNLPLIPPILAGQDIIHRDRENEGVVRYKAIDVARENDTGNYYAYLYTGNLATPKQLHVLNVTNPDNISSTPVAATLPGVNTPASGGESIYFYKDKVYMGTGYMITGNEFHIYDVSSPTSPSHLGSFDVDNNIYRIFVRDQIISGVTKTLAYVTLSASNPINHKEFEIYDVTNPSSISLMGSFNPPGNQYGRALDIIGNKAYLGRESGANPNFYIIDISDPTNPTSCGSCNFNIIGRDITDLSVNNDFAFLAAQDGLRVLVVSDPTNIHTPTVSPYGIYITPLTSLDLDTNKNLVYASHTNLGTKAFYVLYSAP